MKSSKINKASKEELEDLVKSSSTLSELLVHFGLKNKGNNFTTLRNRLEKEGIDIKDLRERSRKRLSTTNRNKILNIELFISDSNKARSVVKTRIIKENLIPYECIECGLTDKWRDKKLVLVLDHINGKSNDHRLDNLRFLCPNCNSQTDTFAGRSTRLPDQTKDERMKRNRNAIRKTICKTCKEYCTIKSKTGLCRTCYLSLNRKSKTRIETNKLYPPVSELQRWVESFGYRETGRRLGVSDNAVRKRLKHTSIAQLVRASG